MKSFNFGKSGQLTENPTQTLIKRNITLLQKGMPTHLNEKKKIHRGGWERDQAESVELAEGTTQDEGGVSEKLTMGGARE